MIPKGFIVLNAWDYNLTLCSFNKKLHDILPMYYDYTGFLSSGTYPAANMLLSKMFTSKKKYTIGECRSETGGYVSY